MLGTQEAGLLVHVTDGTEIASDDLIVCLLASIVFRHFKHAEVQVGDWTERTAGYKNKWPLG